MSTHKTIIDLDLLTDFLKENFSDGISSLEPVVGGEASQAFGFNVGNKVYIIRVNKHYSLGFKKDQYAYLNFSRYDLAIPKILQIGKIDSEYRYCISERAEGLTLNAMTAEAVAELSEPIFDSLDKIHAIDISNYSGYGKWDADAVGVASSWNEYLLTVNKYIEATSDKPGLFETSFLDEGLWRHLYSRMVKLLEYCPKEKFLIHGDYGFGNILVKDRVITGIIDWESSMYGDYLFDIAWLGFWSKRSDYVQLYLNRSELKGNQIDNFQERIKCYQLYIGLGALSFYAYSNQEEKYQKLSDKMINFL